MEPTSPPQRTNGSSGEVRPLPILTNLGDLERRISALTRQINVLEEEERRLELLPFRLTHQRLTRILVGSPLGDEIARLNNPESLGRCVRTTLERLRGEQQALQEQRLRLSSHAAVVGNVVEEGREGARPSQQQPLSSVTSLERQQEPRRETPNLSTTAARVHSFAMNIFGGSPANLRPESGPLNRSMLAREIEVSEAVRRSRPAPILQTAVEERARQPEEEGTVYVPGRILGEGTSGRVVRAFTRVRREDFHGPEEELLSSLPPPLFYRARTARRVEALVARELHPPAFTSSRSTTSTEVPENSAEITKEISELSAAPLPSNLIELNRFREHITSGPISVRRAAAEKVLAFARNPELSEHLIEHIGSILRDDIDFLIEPRLRAEAFIKLTEHSHLPREAGGNLSNFLMTIAVEEEVYGAESSHAAEMRLLSLRPGLTSQDIKLEKILHGTLGPLEHGQIVNPFNATYSELVQQRNVERLQQASASVTRDELRECFKLMSHLFGGDLSTMLDAMTEPSFIVALPSLILAYVATVPAASQGSLPSKIDISHLPVFLRRDSRTGHEHPMTTQDFAVIEAEIRAIRDKALTLSSFPKE